jgi:hypothetical protein
MYTGIELSVFLQCAGDSETTIYSDIPTDTALVYRYL